MKQHTLYLLLTISLLCSNCNSPYEYWDITHFNLHDEALSDGEEIKLLYTSRAPNNNKDLEYYIHFIVISQKSGDTVNVFSPINNGFGEGDADKVFNFIHKDNPGFSILLTTVAEISFQDLKKIESKEINKVVRDPNFDDIANNDYESIIGAVGVTTLNNTTVEY